MHPLIALVTLLTVVLMIACTIPVGRARGKYGIKAPACSGHEGFECAYRAHMNTVEQTVMFLPVLWIASLTGFMLWAHWLGVAWILGRVWYIVGYNKAPSARSQRPATIFCSMAFASAKTLVACSPTTASLRMAG